jgi:hypothetical protein
VKTVRIVGMTGHQGLPVHTVKLVTTALRDQLKGYGSNLVGVTMLGPGADQLFARVVLELGGSLHVVVPATKYRDAFDDEAAQRGYDELYAKATYFKRLDFTDSTEHAHMEGGKAVVDRVEVLIAVWDGLPARGLGGTADVVAYAKQRGRPVEVIWPEGATR